MTSAFYQTPSHDNAPHNEGRVATTVTLIAVATCMILAKSLAVQPTPAAQLGAGPAVRIFDPDFCKNQTWPYIDERCLKRVAPDQAVTENHPATVSNPVVGTLPVPSAPATNGINAAVSTGGLNVSSQSELPTANSAAQLNAPPATDPNAVQNDITKTLAPNAAIAPYSSSANARAVAVQRSHRYGQHWPQHGSFFGFRF